LDEMYGKEGKVKAVRGTKHTFLEMNFDFSKKGKVQIEMFQSVDNIFASFPEEIKKKAETPAGSNLFEVCEDEHLLSKEWAEEYHTLVAKGLFLGKRARPDIQPTIAVLCSRVKEPRVGDWEKLRRLMEYLNNTRTDVLTLSADDIRVLKWYVDASFAVHPDFKSHTGGVLMVGQGAIQSVSRKQKLNTTSSTTAELVAADDMSTLILWTKLFLEEQGYPIEKNVLYQDNKSAISLEKNGRKSAGKRNRALHCRYFFIADQCEKGNLTIEWCPTDEMVADFNTKPLQGEKFRAFCRVIMGFDV